MESIDKSTISTPHVDFSEIGKDQIKLIMENDFTLKGKYFRIIISGKGCHGFDYQVGFDHKKENDFIVLVKGLAVDVLMDPFSAYYLQNVTIDYVQDFEKDTEGFIVLNHNQDTYRGKFWKKNSKLIPPVLKTTTEL